MNFKYQDSLSKKKSNKSLQFRGDRLKVTNPLSIPNTPTSSKLSQVASTIRIQTVNISEKQENKLDLNNKRITRIQQVSLDSEPKQLFRKASQLTIQSDSDLANFIQIQTTRTTREHKLDLQNQLRTPKKEFEKEQKNNKFQKCEPQKNNNILDLLLLNTQQLKDIFQKVKEPQIRQKPKINNVKGFPSDFFSIQ